MARHLPYPKNDPDAVAHLEDKVASLTAIDYRDPLGPPEDGLNKVVSRGANLLSSATYARPMFEALPADFHGFQVSYNDPCAACYDFSRSWACSEHPEPTRWTYETGSGAIQRLFTTTPDAPWSPYDPEPEEVRYLVELGPTRNDLKENADDTT